MCKPKAFSGWTVYSDFDASQMFERYSKYTSTTQRSTFQKNYNNNPQIRAFISRLLFLRHIFRYLKKTFGPTFWGSTLKIDGILITYIYIYIYTRTSEMIEYLYKFKALYMCGAVLYKYMVMFSAERLRNLDWENWFENDDNKRIYIYNDSQTSESRPCCISTS